MGPSFLERGPIMYRSCPSVRQSRAYFFLRIVLGTWALTRTENEISIVKILQERPHSGRPLNGRTLLLLYLVAGARFIVSLQASLGNTAVQPFLFVLILLGGMVFPQKYLGE